jgi:hypothetical protein
MPAQAQTQRRPRREAAPVRGGVRQATRNASPEGEDFDWSPVQAALEEEGADTDAGSSALSNVATRFSTPSVQVQPVTNKTSKRKQAQDILRFFKLEDVVEGNKTVKKKVCQLCRYSYSLPMVLLLSIHPISSPPLAPDARERMTPQRSINFQYAAQTSTGSLCNHLRRVHHDLYISTCLQEGWMDYLDEHEKPGYDATRAAAPRGPSAPLIPFSQEGLIDALVKFIVADDQVSYLFISPVFLCSYYIHAVYLCR